MSVFQLSRRNEVPYRNVSQIAPFLSRERIKPPAFLRLSLHKRIKPLQSHCRGQEFDPPQLHHALGNFKLKKINELSEPFGALAAEFPSLPRTLIGRAKR
jgi:hypothetical protein